MGGAYEIAFDEELDCDSLFFVEDGTAKILFHQLAELWAKHDDRPKPYYKVVPVGGYNEVLSMLENSSEVFPGHVKRIAVLDHDVWTENISHEGSSPNPEAQAIYANSSNRIFFLPCTPEVGLTSRLDSAWSAGDQSALRLPTEGTTINLEPGLIAPEYRPLHGLTDRASAKKKATAICRFVRSKANLSWPEAQRLLYRWYVRQNYGPDLGSLKKLLGPIMHAK